MAEQLIRTSILCERLGGMSKNTAMALMAQYGIYPISLGTGRGKGYFWLSSAVDNALLKMGRDATNRGLTEIPSQIPSNHRKHEEMSLDELQRFLTAETSSLICIPDTFGHSE